MVLTEPRELVFPGPRRPTTLAALDTINRTFPHFQVGGCGEGDSVPVALPADSFVLNRRAPGVVRRGFEAGGVVSDDLSERGPRANCSTRLRAMWSERCATNSMIGGSSPERYILANEICLGGIPDISWT